MGCLTIIGMILGALFFGVSAPLSPSTGQVFEEVVTELATPLPSANNYDAIPQSRTEDGAFLLGDPNAPVTVVAFEDFLCPHCQRYQSTIQDLILFRVTQGEANFEYRMLPAVDPVFSQLAAQLAECSVEQGISFWVAHDELFAIASSERFNNQSARTFADNLNLDYGTLLECTETASQVINDSQLASQLGVSGVPTIGIRINGGDIRLDLLPQQPTLEQLMTVILSNQ